MTAEAPIAAHQCDDVLSLVRDADDRAIQALGDRDVSPMDAIVWASTHLAAVEHAVHPVVVRRLGAGALASHHQQLASLERLLRTLERHHSGDTLASGLDAGRLRDRLVAALVSHSREEQELLGRLLAVLDADECERLTDAYRHAIEHAPTRPHPYTPHHGVLGALAFRVDALRDRVLDVMDGRHVPAPRPASRHTEPGRWGRYVIGVQDRDDD